MIDRKNPTKASMDNRKPRSTSFIFTGSTGGKLGVRLNKIANPEIWAGGLYIEKDTDNCKEYEKKCELPKLVRDVTGQRYGGQQYFHDLRIALDEFDEWSEKIDEAIDNFVAIKSKRPSILASLHNTAGHVFHSYYATLKLKKRLRPRYVIDYIAKPRFDNELALEIFKQYLSFERQYPIYDARIIAVNDRLGENMKWYDYSNLTGLLGILEDTLEAVSYNKFKVFCKTKMYQLESEVFEQPYYPTKIPFYKKRNYGTDVRLISDSIAQMNSVAGSHTAILADIYPEQYEDLVKMQKTHSYLHKILGRPSFLGRYFIATMKPVDDSQIDNDMGQEFREFAEILKRKKLL